MLFSPNRLLTTKEQLLLVGVLLITYFPPLTTLLPQWLK